MAATAVAGGLALIGVLLVVLSEAGDVLRDLGIAVLSGGIVGGALVLVESVLTAAADARSSRESLLTLLSSTIDLHGIDLEGQNLSKQYLPAKAMVAARLDGANLANAMLVFGDFRHASFSRATLDGADLSGSTLVGADLSGASLRGTVLLDVDLSQADLTGADLTGATIEDSRLVAADLRRAVVDGSTISVSRLMGADFSTCRGLQSAQMVRNQHDASTRWPAGYAASPSEVIAQEHIVSMDFATYLAHRASRTSQRGR